jgi:hypothetical protein
MGAPRRTATSGLVESILLPNSRTKRKSMSATRLLPAFVVILTGAAQDPPKAEPVAIPDVAKQPARSDVAQANQRSRPAWSRDRIEMLVNPAWQQADEAARLLKGSGFTQAEIDELVKARPTPVGRWIESACQRFHESLIQDSVSPLLSLSKVIAIDDRRTEIPLMTYDVRLRRIDAPRPAIQATLHVQLYMLRVDNGRVAQCELLLEDRTCGDAAFLSAQQRDVPASLEQAVPLAVDDALTGGGRLGGANKLAAVLASHPQFDSGLTRAKPLAGPSATIPRRSEPQ